MWSPHHPQHTDARRAPSDPHSGASGSQVPEDLCDDSPLR